MNSSITSVLEILNSAQSLNSVGFSSGYNFDASAADIYFEELIENANFDLPIFSGILILEKLPEGESLTIVDGLQRLTTISLLLSALCEGSKNTTKKNEDAINKIFTRYLTDDSKPKLKLGEGGQETLQKIIFSMPLSEEEIRGNLYQSYQRFMTNINNRKISATSLFKIISKIQFMVVTVDDSKFSARELYQSLNGKKDDMSHINLITNFVSQHSDPDLEGNSLEIWDRTVKSYRDKGLISTFNSFVKDFLTVQNNGVVTSKYALYSRFKNYFYKMSKYQSPEQILEHVNKYSKFYLKILQADFEDFEIQKQIITINETNGKDAYPYLMEVLDDLENGHIDRQVFLDILVMINSYLFDREATGDYSKVMNFASLSSDLSKMIALKSFAYGAGGEESDQESDDNKVTINEINQSLLPIVNDNQFENND